MNFIIFYELCKFCFSEFSLRSFSFGTFNPFRLKADRLASDRYRSLRLNRCLRGCYDHFCVLQMVPRTVKVVPRTVKVVPRTVNGTPDGQMWYLGRWMVPRTVKFLRQIGLVLLCHKSSRAISCGLRSCLT